jgi:hypothetical protein
MHVTRQEYAIIWFIYINTVDEVPQIRDEDMEEVPEILFRWGLLGMSRVVESSGGESLARVPLGSTSFNPWGMICAPSHVVAATISSREISPLRYNGFATCESNTFVTTQRELSRAIIYKVTILG